MSQTRKIFEEFDQLTASVESADAKLILQAMRLQMQLMSIHLSQIEMNTAHQQQKDARNSAYIVPPKN